MIIKFTWAMALCAPHLAAATGTQDRVAFDDQLDRIEPRIVGGSPASEGEYPSYAIPRTGSFGDGLCGSVKIWNDILLSAAHCAGSFVGNDMLIGGNQRSGSDALEVIPAVAERRHPGYSDVTLENDFLLIKLAEASTVAPSSSWNTDRFEPRDSDIVSVIGFGTTTQGGFVSDALRDVDVAIVDYDTCNSIYRGEIAEDTMICAYRNNADSCQGDRYVPISDVDVEVKEIAHTSIPELVSPRPIYIITSNSWNQWRAYDCWRRNCDWCRLVGKWMRRTRFSRCLRSC